MKKLFVASLSCLALLAFGPVIALHAENTPAGHIEFGKFTPSASGGEFIEVNVTSSLIALASQLVDKEDKEIGQLLRSVQSVRVTCMDMDDDNRADLQKRATKIRAEMDSKGWERIVTVQDHEQTVGVYLKSRNKDTVEGIVVLVTEGDKKAIFVNIVGDIKPDQIGRLGEKLHIDPLKKLGEVTGGHGEKGDKAEKEDK